MAQRLNKYLAHSTGISRRDADMAISQGRIRIDGKPAALGMSVDDNSQVEMDGRLLKSKQTYTYLAFHKPVNYVCSRRRQGSAPTIYELLPERYRSLKPVGRLDKNSSGLLLLTDDGDFAHSMTHPSFHKTKRYEISLSDDLQPLHHQMITDHGISLEDGISRLQLAKDKDDRHWIVEMHEGRNRQIRRTFAALGYTVNQLHRTRFGKYDIGQLQPGSYRPVQQ